MNAGLVLNNLVAYSLQIGMLVGLLAFVPALLRLRLPGARLVYWQVLLVACLLLPLVRPWKQEAIAATVQVTTVITAVQPVHSAPKRSSIPATDIGLAVLVGGAVIRLAWLAAGFWKLRLYRRRSRPLEPAPSWGVEASLRLSDDVASPVTFGWRKPVVLLPAAFPKMGSRVQDAILCHEVLHVRRGDWLFMVGEEVVRALLWFHPAIWWLLGEVGLAREQEVDRLAIGITNERDEYMDALLAIAGARARLDLAPAPLFLRKRHLRQRVVQILKETAMSKTRLISALAAGLGILVAACWLVTGTFPLMAAPQVANDAPGVTVGMNGAAVLHRAGVPYPMAALEQRIQGTLSVEVKLDNTGNVSDAKVLSGPEELRKSALQSVLQWHFTREAAGTTKVVQITYDWSQGRAQAAVVMATAPIAGVVGGVAGGVPGGVQGGVIGGIIGSAPIGPVRVTEIPRTFSSSPVPTVRTIHSIYVVGLSDAARNELLSRLPVHEGDTMTTDLMGQTFQRTREFDEHLVVRFPPSGDQYDVLISAPGSAMVSAQTLPAPVGVPQADTPPQRIRVAGNVQAAMVLQKVPPIYPQLAKSARIEGTVHLAVLIAKDGTVEDVRVLGGPALLIQAAMDAVKQWIYRPTLLNGQRVTVETTVDVNFALMQ